MDLSSYSEPIPLPRGGVELPLVLKPPPGFRPEDSATWPLTPGRLEFVDGRLLYMPPCGDEQGDVAVPLSGILDEWSMQTPEFVVSSNEAGMILGREIRGADAAVWRRTDAGDYSGGFRRTAPILAIEIAGKDEPEDRLRVKARWYFDHGVKLVWLALPASRELVVLRPDQELRLKRGDRVPPAPEVPGLEPSVDRLFRQLPA